MFVQSVHGEWLADIETDAVDFGLYCMDTDDLSEEAYEVLTIAHGINEFLWVELGALSSKYEDEEWYLEGALKFIRKIRKDPEGFQDLWLLEEPINDKHLLQLADKKGSKHLIPSKAFPRILERGRILTINYSRYSAVRLYRKWFERYALNDPVRGL